MRLYDPTGPFRASTDRETPETRNQREELSKAHLIPISTKIESLARTAPASPEDMNELTQSPKDKLKVDYSSPGPKETYPAYVDRLALDGKTVNFAMLRAEVANRPDLTGTHWDSLKASSAATVGRVGGSTDQGPPPADPSGKTEKPATQAQSWRK